MTDLAYKRAPITEAVIEIRFSTALESKILEKVAKKFKKHYPEFRQVETHHVKIDIKLSDGKHSDKIEHEYRLSSNDSSQILILQRQSFIIVQLAPYKGWNNFINRFEQDIELFKKHAGHRQIARIGVRYINRLDIPFSGSAVRTRDYLSIFPQHPDGLNPLIGYSINTKSVLIDLGSVLTINSAIVESPLPNYLSIVLDQDIGIDKEPPQSTEDVIKFLGLVRDKKNEIFESCITDKSRELFSK